MGCFFKAVSAIMVLLVTAPDLAMVEGMTAVLMNNMNQDVKVGCYSKTGFLGERSVTPSHSYIFEVSEGDAYAGLKYHCTFVAAGKPSTTLDVFVGTGGLHNSPCECLGDFCAWSVTNYGFSCNFNAYTHKWGN